MKTPLYRYTFRNQRIREWVETQAEGGALNLFAGNTMLSCDYIRNDLDESMCADYHMDALEFCESWDGDFFETVILDPPYSYRKSMEMYNGKKMSNFNALKNAVDEILMPGGVVITFGYHSVSMGKVRGYEQEHLLIVYAGGAIHDVMAIKERKVD
jgi:hypothetical protein